MPPSSEVSTRTKEIMAARGDVADARATELVDAADEQRMGGLLPVVSRAV